MERSSSFDEQFIMCRNAQNLQNANIPKRRISLERQEESILRNAIQPLRQESDETISLPELSSLYDDDDDDDHSQLVRPKGSFTRGREDETSMSLLANAMDSICLTDVYFLDDSSCPSYTSSSSLTQQRLSCMPNTKSWP
jgi:hypothetical protein